MKSGKYAKSISYSIPRSLNLYNVDAPNELLKPGVARPVAGLSRLVA